MRMFGQHNSCPINPHAVFSCLSIETSDSGRMPWTRSSESSRWKTRRDIGTSRVFAMITANAVPWTVFLNGASTFMQYSVLPLDGQNTTFSTRLKPFHVLAILDLVVTVSGMGPPRSQHEPLLWGMWARGGCEVRASWHLLLWKYLAGGYVCFCFKRH